MLNRIHDVRVTGATTKIAIQRMRNLFACRLGLRCSNWTPAMIIPGVQ